VLGRPVGIYPEPDWLGLMCAVGALVAWYMIESVPRRVFVVVLNLTGWVLAFARAAWLGLLVAVAIAAILWVARLNPGRQRRGLLAIAVVGVFAVGGLFAVSSSFRSDIGSRLDHTLHPSASDISRQARQRQNATLEDLIRHGEPWNGYGLSAAGRVGVYGGLNTDAPGIKNNVASNWIYGSWVDSGLLSIPYILVFIGGALYRPRRLAAQALIVVLVNSLFSDAVYFPVAWLLLGLSFAIVGETPPESTIEADESNGDSVEYAYSGDRLRAVTRTRIPKRARPSKTVGQPQL
jgi:hypothetical protein